MPFGIFFFSTERLTPWHERAKWVILYKGKRMQTIDRGKIKIIDHFMENVPSHWRLSGDAVIPSSNGLKMNANSRLRQQAITTFGFFRFRIELDLREHDEFSIRLHTSDEVIELRFDSLNKAYYQHEGVQPIVIDVPKSFTVQWILNDERYSLQLIGKGITTLASRMPICSFYTLPYEIELQTTISKGSVTILESYYESVNE